MGNNACCGNAREPVHDKLSFDDPGVPAPPEFCGFWFANALSIETRLGTEKGRKGHGLKAAQNIGFIAWIIVDPEDHSLEWYHGDVQLNGSLFTHSAYKGMVRSWKGEEWEIIDVPQLGKRMLSLTGMVYEEIDQMKLLVAFNMEGVRLERTLMIASAEENQSAAITLDEAGELGIREDCVGALVETLDLLESDPNGSTGGNPNETQEDGKKTKHAGTGEHQGSESETV
eukprot:TRINITY_DN19442_c0_g2_i1.p1 TRINITY_DN19442_c0_g2~~TRINITY_DN19442_c0_g2_i1.p1  ORF type:complete len:229 (-),score=42.76 TRINITY_DN19442_c0_g2_i1:140-826(-)